MSTQDKLDRSAEKHGLGSDKRIRRIKKAKDFFSKPVPTYSKDELRKMGHPVEQKESSKVPAGMKFIASYVYKDAKGKEHTHRHLRKGSKMSDPVVVYIDDKEWKTFQSFTKAKQAAINHIKGMKESVETNEGMFDEAYRKPTQAEIDADKRKERKASGKKRPSISYSSLKKKVYGNAMGGLKDAAGQEFTAVPLDTTGEVSGGDRMSIAKLDAIMQKRTKDKRQKESVETNEDTAIAHQTPYGTVTAYKRDTKGMRGKQDGFKLTLKTKSGKTVDLGSHPKPTKANVLSIVKNVMQKESVDLEETNESSLPPHLQKIIGKDGQIDKKKVDQHVHGKKTKVTDVTPKGYGPKESVEQVEEANAPSTVKYKGKTYYSTGKRGKHAKTGEWHSEYSSDMDGGDERVWYNTKKKKITRESVQFDETNESVATADKKPQNYRDPDTGKLKTRMVPVDKDVVRGNDAAKVVKKKTFRSIRGEQNEKV